MWDIEGGNGGNRGETTGSRSGNVGNKGGNAGNWEWKYSLWETKTKGNLRIYKNIVLTVWYDKQLKKLI